MCSTDHILLLIIPRQNRRRPPLRRRNSSFTRTIMDEEPEEDEEVVHHRGGGASHPASRASVNAPRSVLEGGEEVGAQDGDDPFAARREAGGTGLVNSKIADRESEYQARRRNQMVRSRGGCPRGEAQGRFRSIVVTFCCNTSRFG